MWQVFLVRLQSVSFLCRSFYCMFSVTLISLYEFVFTINSDFDRPERKGHWAKVPGSEMTRERKGQGASWPGNESARVLLAVSLRGANWPGSEKARYPSEHTQHIIIFVFLYSAILRIFNFLRSNFKEYNKYKMTPPVSVWHRLHCYSVGLISL